MAKETRTVDDFSDDEYQDYEEHPEKYEDVTDNTNDMYEDMMYPDGRDD